MSDELLANAVLQIFTLSSPRNRQGVLRGIQIETGAPEHLFNIQHSAGRMASAFIHQGITTPTREEIRTDLFALRFTNAEAPPRWYGVSLAVVNGLRSKDPSETCYAGFAMAQAEPIAKHKARAGWERILKGALDADIWGQALEAIDEYAKLVTAIERDSELMTDVTSDERSVMHKIRLTAHLRAEALRSLNRTQGLRLDLVKKLLPVVQDMFTPKQVSPAAFPVPLDNFTDSLTALAGQTAQTQNTEIEVKESVKGTGSTLLGPLQVKRSGVTLVSVLLEQIGLKDASSYIDARVAVSLVNGAGVRQGDLQVTAPTNNSQDNVVIIGTEVHLQSPLEDMQKDWAIFLEFQHYKPKKKKVSTRCFSFMEMDEIQRAQKGSGALQLQLYKKPTDFTKKNISLLSIKEYALFHVKLRFQTV